MRKLFANLAFNLYLLLSKGDEEMMAMLFAIRVVEERTTFDKVPNKLKAAVAEILINDFELPDLVPDEYK